MGFVFYLFTNLFVIFDVTRYNTNDNYTIDYAQGYGGVNVDFRMNYRYYNSFNSRLIFHTISSGEVEEIGITRVSYDIYKDMSFMFDNNLVFSTPVTEGYDFYVVGNVQLHDNISCIGFIDAQFNVEGIVHNERFNFTLSIIMPVNPIEINGAYLMNLIWAEYGLGVLLAVLIGLIFRTIQIWRRESSYAEEDKKKDGEFWQYIGEKLEEFKKETS
ncbi:MAG: hypothetical protein ACFFCY_16615 [Promethearchaeota archaeon]